MSGNGFDKARVRCRVSQRTANPADCFVDAVVEVNDRVRPKSLAYLLSRYQVSRSLEKHYQQAERLLRQPEGFPLLGELAAAHIRFKAAELQASQRLLGCIHKQAR